MEGTLTRTRATVVIPTYNEAANIAPLVRRICAAIPGVAILFVDDASNDGTAEQARQLAAEWPITVIERFDERGLSTAVLRGLAAARTDICVVMDADLSHPPEAIPSLVQAIEEGAEVAVGSRYVPGGAIDDWPLVRRLASKAGTALARPLTAIRDPMAGFFCLRRSLLEGLELKPRGFKILLEILARSRVGNVREVPIRFEDRNHGESKFDSHERKEFLKQVWTLYRELNAWPWRLAKFLATGSSGYLVHMAVLCALVEVVGVVPILAAVGGFGVATTSNYVLNRIWTFRARRTSVPTSYAIYTVGALAGLGVQVVTMWALSRIHYALAASLGIVLGTLFTFLTGDLWAFRKR